MSSRRYIPEFKDEAVHQIIDRDYCVAAMTYLICEASDSLDANKQYEVRRELVAASQ